MRITINSNLSNSPQNYKAGSDNRWAFNNETYTATFTF